MSAPFELKKRWLIFLSPLLLVVVLDQWTKVIIRTTPELHQLTLIDGVLEFLFLQNPGMALGIRFFSTPVVGVISILATMAIMIHTILHFKSSTLGYIGLIGAILGGAVGNIIDRIFMGFIQGSGGFLNGHVVDFIHFSLRIGDFAVFPYVFNVADMAVSVSAITLLLFNKKLMPSDSIKIGSDESIDEHAVQGESETQPS